MLDAGISEEFSSGIERGAGGVDIVEEEIDSIGIDETGEGVGFGGLSGAIFGFGADLDGVDGAGEEGLTLPAAEMGEVLSEGEGMVKTASADMLTNGGEGDDNDGLVLAETWRNGSIIEFGESGSNGADGVVFVIVDEIFERGFAPAEGPEVSKNRGAIWADTARERGWGRFRGVRGILDMF